MIPTTQGVQDCWSENCTFEEMKNSGAKDGQQRGISPLPEFPLP
jgi:hypothetical protein